MPTRSPSPQLFRGAIVAAGVCYALGVALPDSGLVALSPDVATARGWNNYEALLPQNAIIFLWAGLTAVLVIALIGMWFFWSPSRWLLASGYALGIAITPFLGLLVTEPLEGTLAAIATTLVVWLVAVSYWSPLSERFSRPKEEVRT